MPLCLIPGCFNNAEHNLGIRCRRPDTTAIWAPNCDAYLCNTHAEEGYVIDIILTAAPTRTITTRVNAGGHTTNRTTSINHDSVE